MQAHLLSTVQVILDVMDCSARNCSSSDWRLALIDYSKQDAPIDEIIWQAIADSSCPKDFRDYLKHSPEGSVHLDEAIERLIALDDSDATCADDQCCYPSAVGEVSALATDGNAVAQFHMGKMLDRGIGGKADPQRAEGWYRAAIMQGESRSHINLAIRLEQRRDPKYISEVKQLFADAARVGEVTGDYHLARLVAEGYGELENTPDKLTAFALFHQAWEKGSAVSGHWIGHMLLRGEGVRQDLILAAEWLEKSAWAGCVGAILQIGSDAEFGRNREKDLATAMDWYRQGAELRSPECQHRLASLLLRGEGIAKDGAKAVNWLKRAAVCGDSDAQRILGLTYLWGVDVVRNPRFGYKWLTRAAEGGDAYAALQLGKFLHQECPPELEAGAKWLEQAAKSGDSEAQALLGTCYWGGRGVAIDFRSAHKWIKLSSLQGDPHGLFLLGRLHYSGIDVPEDFVQAARYFRQAAERGHAGGQAKLGWCYLRGDGVEQDIPEGMLWLSQAAEKGSAEACTTIGHVLRDGIGVECDPGEASKWFLDAAERGNAQGQYDLAMLYATGKGLARNLTEARKWMEKSAEQGHEGAIAWLKSSSDNVVEISPS